MRVRVDVEKACNQNVTPITLAAHVCLSVCVFIARVGRARASTQLGPRGSLPRYSARRLAKYNSRRRVSLIRVPALRGHFLARHFLSFHLSKTIVVRNLSQFPTSPTLFTRTPELSCSKTKASYALFAYIFHSYLLFENSFHKSTHYNNSEHSFLATLPKLNVSVN